MRVFLSHTSELREFPGRRSFVAAAERAITRARETVMDMEYFTAREDKPADYCRRELEQADVYVGIIGFRYGSPVKDKTEQSYVELEWEVATQRGLPRYIFLLDEKAALPLPRMYLSDPDLDHEQRQREFRTRLKDAGVTVKPVDSPDALETGLFQALKDLQEERRAARPSSEQPSAAGPATSLLTLASTAQQRLQDALAVLRRATRAMDRFEHHGVAPPGMDYWEYDDQEAVHRQLAASMTGPAEDLESRSEQAAQIITEARDRVRQLRQSGFTQLPGRLAPMIETVSELEGISGELRDRITWSLDDLEARKRECDGYNIPCAILSRAADHIENASSDVTSMEKGLGRLQAVPAAPAARPATGQPDQGKAPTRRTTATRAEARNVPVAGKAAAGRPVSLTGEDSESVPVPVGHARRDNIFAVKVQGDSMSGDDMGNGDYVIVDPNQAVNDGDIAVVRIGNQDDAEALIKHLWREKTTIRLESSNPAYKPETFGPQDNYEVEGRVIGIFHPVN